MDDRSATGAPRTCHFPHSLRWIRAWKAQNWKEVESAAKQMGYVDRPTNQTDMIFVGLGILIGGLIGALTIHWGGVPISLSTSGGALIAGLVFGWLRSKHPTLGAIQDAVESDTPALGYTVTYAIGNTLLIIWGVVIVLIM